MNISSRMPALWSVRLRIGRFGLAMMAAAVLAGGCDAENDGPDIDLDSAGARIERGAEKVGRELDTAFTGIKTQVNESQIEGALNRLRGMENVEVELTPQGEVHLTGSVATEESRRLAEEITRNIQGVSAVRNDLVVGPALDTIPRDTTRPDSVRL